MTSDNFWSCTSVLAGSSGRRGRSRVTSWKPPPPPPPLLPVLGPQPGGAVLSVGAFGRGCWPRTASGGQTSRDGWWWRGCVGQPFWLSSMDLSLLRERALSTPVVEKCSVSSESSPSSYKKKKGKLEHGGSSAFKQNSDHSNGSFNLKALSGSSGYKFGVLAKIVNYMKVSTFN